MYHNMNCEADWEISYSLTLLCSLSTGGKPVPLDIYVNLQYRIHREQEGFRLTNLRFALVCV